MPAGLRIQFFYVSSFTGMLIGAPLLGALSDRFGRKLIFGLDLILFVAFAVFVLAAWFLFDIASYGIGFDIPLTFRELGFPSDYRLTALGGMIVSLGAIVGYAAAILPAPETSQTPLEDIVRRYYDEG
jgi:MFS family permease